MECLTGPTSDNPSVPFVLVGAAHCNFVCKDGDTGNTLETCCCRPDSVLSSCLSKSPYCVGKPEFKLAEPKVSSLPLFQLNHYFDKDLEIVCGQFDSDTEIASFSKEVEEVFQVTEIINHPDYQPHKVTSRQGLGE